MERYLSSKVIGTIDGVSDLNGQYFVKGWACSVGLSDQIRVDFYAGGPAGSGTGVTSGFANLPSEPAVGQACHDPSNTPHRFRLPISLGALQAFAGKTIFIHGISPVGAVNPLLTHSSNFLIPTSQVVGTIDGVSDSNGQYFVTGWACSVGLSNPIRVDLYAGGPVGSGTGVTSGLANLPSAAAIGQACHDPSNSPHRFRLPISTGALQAFAGKTIFIHGISPVA